MTHQTYTRQIRLIILGLIVFLVVLTATIVVAEVTGARGVDYTPDVDVCQVGGPAAGCAVVVEPGFTG